MRRPRTGPAPGAMLVGMAAMLACAAVPGTASASTDLASTAPASTAPASTAGTGGDGVRQICRSWTEHQRIAARMSRAIIREVRDRRARTPVVAVRVDDPAEGIGCWLRTRRHFDSASVVKVIILAALLRKVQAAQHRWLTVRERLLAWRMITESDNAAATALWNESAGTGCGISCTWPA